MAEELADNEHLGALLTAVCTEARGDDVQFADAAAVANTRVLDAVLVGPPRSGTSTVAGALLGQVLCPPPADALLPVAFSLAPCLPNGGATGSANTSGRWFTELRVPGALRALLARGGAPGASEALPEDGIVEDEADLGRRLSALHRAARTSAEAILSALEPAATCEPVEVIRYGPVDNAQLTTRWRFVDVPGCAVAGDRGGDAAACRLAARMLEIRRHAPCTAALITVVDKDQVRAAQHFNLGAHDGSSAQRLWLVNKVDNEDDYHEARQGAEAFDRLTKGDRVFYISAVQILAYHCAEELGRRGAGASVLPPMDSPAYHECPREVEAVVKVLVPASSRKSWHWKKQYSDALACTRARLCRATQFPVLDHEGSSGEEDVGGMLYPIQGQGECGHSDNSLVRAAVAETLGAGKLHLSLQRLRPLVVAAIVDIRANPPMALVVTAGANSGKEENCDKESAAAMERLCADVRRCTEARAGLQRCLSSDRTLDKDRLTESIIEVAEKHIQGALDEVGKLVASGVTQQSELLSHMNQALETAEESLMQLQRDWILQGDPLLAKLCDDLGLVEPAALVEEVERQSGVARNFESVVFMLLAKCGACTKEPTSWFAGTAKLYADGIRSVAPAAADRVVDAAKEKLVSARSNLEEDVAQHQWDLAELDWWIVRLTRLQSLLTAILCIVKGMHVDLVDGGDLSYIQSGQREFVQAWTGTIGRARSAVADMASHCPGWVWWTASSAQAAAASRFRELHGSERAPASADELKDAVRQLTSVHAVRRGLSRAMVSYFVMQIFNEAISACSGKAGLAQIASHLWSSSLQLRGHELCTLINEAFREDTSSLVALRPAVQLLLALEPLRAPAPAAGPSLTLTEPEWWPPSGRVFRGGILPDRHRHFFYEGRQYRAPMALMAYVASDAALAFAQRQVAQAGGQTPVLWTIRLHPSSRPYLLESGRGELLFAAHGCFHVDRVQWRQDGATAEVPHRVEISACPPEDDNSDWPAGPWC